MKSCAKVNCKSHKKQEMRENQQKFIQKSKGLAFSCFFFGSMSKMNEKQRSVLTYKFQLPGMWTCPKGAIIYSQDIDTFLHI